jgi:hypothetical protein
MPTGVIIIIATMRNVKNKSKPPKKTKNPKELDFQTEQKQKSNGIKVLCWACNINLVLLVKSVYITAGAINTVVTLFFFKKHSQSQ